MEKLNDTIVKVAGYIGNLYPNDAGFIKAVNNGARCLEALPRTFEFEFSLDLSPERLGQGSFEPLLNLTTNVSGWLGFFVYTNAYRVHQILRALINSLNTKSYVPAVILSRSLMEYAATLDYHARQLNPKFQELDQILSNPNKLETKESLIAAIGQLIEILKICRRYSRLTRFNWDAYAKGDLENFFRDWTYVDEGDKQINIVTLIDKIPQKDNGVRFFYDMLSDFAHPNLGSLALIMDNASRINSNKAKYALSRDTVNEELLGMVVHCIAIPTKVSLKIITHWLDSFKHTLKGMTKWIEMGQRLLGE